MKHLIIATLFILLCSCTVSSFRSHPGAAIIPQLSTMGKVADLTHHLAKRQTNPSIQDIFDCAAIQIDYICSSDYAQRSVDIALSCGNATIARTTATECARSENGEFCGTATLRFILTAADASTCTGAVASGSCPSNCRSFLESASSRLGCCINTYINNTFNPLATLYDSFLDYRLWNLCNVPLPAADCGNGLPLNPPQDAQTCTLQELFIRLANHACTPSVGQPLVDALLENSKCYSFARQLVDICSTNDNDEYCAVVLGSDVLSSIDTSNEMDPLLTSLILNCASVSTSCDPSCQSAITNIKNSYGCCVNIFNVTNVGLTQLSYSVWNSCGVDTPGVCTASMLSGAATVKVFAWMIAVAMAIHMALCTY